MKRLFTLVAIALLASACAGPQEQKVSLYNEHCREHAEDPYTADFAPERFNECLALHVKGIVPSDSTDEHLAGIH